MKNILSFFIVWNQTTLNLEAWKMCCDNLPFQASSSISAGTLIKKYFILTNESINNKTEQLNRLKWTHHIVNFFHLFLLPCNYSQHFNHLCLWVKCERRHSKFIISFVVIHSIGKVSLYANCVEGQSNDDKKPPQI